jgi:hypothetical protein
VIIVPTSKFPVVVGWYCRRLNSRYNDPINIEASLNVSVELYKVKHGQSNVSQGKKAKKENYDSDVTTGIPNRPAEP